MINKLYTKIRKYIKENTWFLVSLITIILIFNINLPYYIETPGGYISLADRININGEYGSDGELGMTYVSMIKGNIPFILFSFIDKNWDLVKKSDLVYENETEDEMNARDKLDLEESIDNATIVAYQEAGKYVNITMTKLYVTFIDSNYTELKVMDQILKVNGIDVSNYDELKEKINEANFGDYLTLTILRDNKEMEVKSIVNDLNGEKKLNAIIGRDYDYVTEPAINVKMKSNESGPSGGLMLALSIYNKLVSEDITRGLKIAGTGTIDVDGNVGEIGGVKYKLIGAVKNKAKVFLCPMGNLEEAKAVAENYKYDIIVIGVASFDQALNELRNL